MVATVVLRATRTGPGVTAQDHEGQSGGAGHVPVGQPGVAVLVQLQGKRPAVLDGVAETMQGSDPGVAAPGEDQSAHASHADHLVEEQVRRQPDQGQVLPALADDLLAGGEGDQVGEPLEGDAVTVVDQPVHGRVEIGDTCHGGRQPVVSSPVATVTAVPPTRGWGEEASTWIRLGLPISTPWSTTSAVWPRCRAA